MKILALDLGKFKSVACIYRSDNGDHRFSKVPTNPQDIHDLIVEQKPDRIVIEIGSQVGRGGGEFSRHVAGGASGLQGIFASRQLRFDMSRRYTVAHDRP